MFWELAGSQAHIPSVDHFDFSLENVKQCLLALYETCRAVWQRQIGNATLHLGELLHHVCLTEAWTAVASHFWHSHLFRAPAEEPQDPLQTHRRSFLPPLVSVTVAPVLSWSRPLAFELKMRVRLYPFPPVMEFWYDIYRVYKHL